MAATTFMTTFNADGNTEGATFTKDQLQEWATNAAAAGSKNVISDGSDTETTSTRKQRKTKGKQKRGEHQPKRPMSGYMLYLSENRAAIKTELLKDNEKVTVGDVAKVGGAQWKALGDAEKAKFTEQSDTLKKEYDAAMETWRTEHPEEATAKKEPKEKKTKKTKTPAAPVNLEDAPSAPPGMSGPFSGFLSKTVKNSDGKASFKDFAEAVAAAMELGDDCGGITRTARGWSIRKAYTLNSDEVSAKRNEFSYIKTKFVTDENAPAPVVEEETPAPVVEEKTPAPVVEEETSAPVVEDAGGKSDYEAETDNEDEEKDEPVYSEDEVETISWEFKGKDYELDEKTGKVYAEDEDGEYELVGYRKIREIEVTKNGKKKIKKEVYIDEPWKN